MLQDRVLTNWVSGYVVSGRTKAQKTCPLPRNGRPLLLHIPWNMFTKSLFSNGHGADPHKKYLLQHLFYGCLRVLRALPSNGSTLLLVAYLLPACLLSRCLTMGICIKILVCLMTVAYNQDTWNGNKFIPTQDLSSFCSIVQVLCRWVDEESPIHTTSSS
jgi:hypothetical protein